MHPGLIRRGPLPTVAPWFPPPSPSPPPRFPPRWCGCICNTLNPRKAAARRPTRRNPPGFQL